MRWSAEITADDIAKGKRYSTRACPIARAFRRETGERVEVRKYSIRIGRRKFSVAGDLLAELVERFDRTGTMPLGITMTFEADGTLLPARDPRSFWRPWKR